MSYNAGSNPQSELDASRFLEAGERIVWQGQPGRGGLAANQMQLGGWIVIGVGTLVQVIFLIVGLVLSNGSASHTTGTVFLFIVLLLFVTMDLTGFILIIVGRNTRNTLRYWLTERQAIISNGPLRGGYRTTLIDLAAVGMIKVYEYRDGSGTIVFGRSSNYQSSGSYGYYNFYDRDYSFGHIADVMSVYRMVRAAQDGLQKAQG